MFKLSSSEEYLNKLYEWRGIQPSTKVNISARVKDIDSWNKISQTFQGVQLGICRKNDEEWIVTARVPTSIIKKLENEPYIISLKVADQVFNEKSGKQEVGDV